MRTKILPVCFWLVLVLTVVLTLGTCSKQTMSLDDARLKPFAAMYSVPRENYGMTALPKVGRAWISEYGKSLASNNGYDAMVHITDKAVHHIAFRKNGESFEWIGEQEVCAGPRKYQSENGLLNEEIEIDLFHDVPHEPEGLKIMYRGPDEKLRMAQNLKPADVEPLLKQWGCH